MSVLHKMLSEPREVEQMTLNPSRPPTGTVREQVRVIREAVNTLRKLSAEEYGGPHANGHEWIIHQVCCTDMDLSLDRIMHHYCLAWGSTATPKEQA